MHCLLSRFYQRKNLSPVFALAGWGRLLLFSSGECALDWFRIQRLVKGCAVPLDNSVASQAVFQVTCCTISGGCQSWSIRLSDAFNTQYYSTFFRYFPGEIVCVCFLCVFLCLRKFVCEYICVSLFVCLQSESLPAFLLTQIKQ